MRLKIVGGMVGLLALAICLRGADDVKSVPPQKSDAAELPGWGRVINPDGDCDFFLSRSNLIIDVPGSTNAHDLASDIGRANAPRVLKEIEGDFILEVKVGGHFDPGEKSTQRNRLPYVGAGLVVMFDTENAITLARAAIRREGETEPTGYANFEIRIDGELRRMGLSGDHPLPSTGPVYLRLQRRGSKIIGSACADGKHWEGLGSKTLPKDWPNSLRVGVVAISTSEIDFDPRFSLFRQGIHRAEW